jgi:hypothetical protein
MKIFVLTMLLATLSGGVALAGHNNPYAYKTCANSNSKACRDARDAFARHHNGQSPEQYNNSWYQGQQGRWNQSGNDWRWNGADGDEYRRGNSGWQWSRAQQKHDHDRD